MVDFGEGAMAKQFADFEATQKRSWDVFGFVGRGGGGGSDAVISSFGGEVCHSSGKGRPSLSIYQVNLGFCDCLIEFVFFFFWLIYWAFC